MFKLRPTLLLFLIILSFACKKPDEYPVIPSISLKEVYTVQDSAGYDQNVIVVLNFTDGDGDIGYHSPESGLNDPVFDDPQSQYYNNFIVTVWKKNNGAWEKDTLTSTGQPFNISGRIPYLTPSGKNKALKGEIKRTLPVDVGLNNDTFRYDIFIYDRALHSSNLITTPEVIQRTR